jgi:rhamnosyltransferase
MNELSVVIRCRNEENHIGFAIQSVIDHFYPYEPEIIIVDNGSTDESMKVVSLFDRYDIKKYSIDKNYTPGKALNFGVQKSTKETVLVLSAHSQITKTNLDSVVEDLKENVAVFGNQVPLYMGKRITKRYVWSHFVNCRKRDFFSEIENRYFLHNAFCFYNRQVLLDNPFDETLSGKEDRYWIADMIEKGNHFLYDGVTNECNHFWTPNGATWKGIG